MVRSSDETLQCLTVHLSRGVVEFGGAELVGISPCTRCWRAIEVLARNGARPTTVEEMFDLCAGADSADPKGAVHDVIRRLRQALGRALPGGAALLETCPGGGWRFKVVCAVMDRAA